MRGTRRVVLALVWFFAGACATATVAASAGAAKGPERRSAVRAVLELADAAAAGGGASLAPIVDELRRLAGDGAVGPAAALIAYNALIKAGREGEALNLLRYEIDSKRAVSATWLRLGTYLLRAGGLAEAELMFERAWAQDRTPEAAYYLGHMGIMTRRYDVAEEYFMWAMALDGSDGYWGTMALREFKSEIGTGTGKARP